ncbi:hypothetical protein [Coleofasciculus sp. H7-2]|uniref:hypothetical protein n=1 Tax=Coleofasciculus sp. H7-2 TaxID=3351545 RepID=UPI0036721E66
MLATDTPVVPLLKWVGGIVNVASKKRIGISSIRLMRANFLSCFVSSVEKVKLVFCFAYSNFQVAITAELTNLNPLITFFSLFFKLKIIFDYKTLTLIRYSVFG